MTKADFLVSVPDIIEHKTWGYGELEICADSKNNKGAGYRHKDNTSSCSTFGTTWLEVSEKLRNHLRSEGYIE